MRVVLAIVGSLTFAGTLALSANVLTPVASPLPAATPPARATADPSVTHVVVPEEDRGRVADADRPDRLRRSVSGLLLPIEGVGLPTDEFLLPNAPRDLRAGWHEGIDFAAPEGTPVRAIAAGVVTRIDHDFADWSSDELARALADAVERGYTPSHTLDRIRGRQVWIDHGRGIVSRYAHLSHVEALTVGARVAAGDVIGRVGSSGYPQGGPHLHLEVWMGAGYLGEALTGDALAKALADAFVSGSPFSR